MNLVDIIKSRSDIATISNDISKSDKLGMLDMLDVLDINLPVFLTKYFYFNAIRPLHQQYIDKKCQNSNTHDCGSEFSGDIFDEIDEEPYDPGRCSICYRDRVSLIKFCKCKDIMYCYECIMHHIKSSIEKVIHVHIKTYDALGYVNANATFIYNISNLVNPSTGRICDVKMLAYLSKISKIPELSCINCYHINLQYPNVNEVLSHKDILDSLIKMQYYDNESSDSTVLIAHDLMKNPHNYPPLSQVPILEYQNLKIEYHLALLQEPNNSVNPGQYMARYFMSPNTNIGHAPNHPLSSILYKHIIPPSFDIASQLIPNAKYTRRLINKPLQDCGGNIMVSYYLDNLCLDIARQSIAMKVKNGNGNGNGDDNGDRIRFKALEKFKNKWLEQIDRANAI